MYLNNNTRIITMHVPKIGQEHEQKKKSIVQGLVCHIKILLNNIFDLIEVRGNTVSYFVQVSNVSPYIPATSIVTVNVATPV